MERRVETSLIKRTHSDYLIGFDFRIPLDAKISVIIAARDHFLPVIIDRRPPLLIMAFAIRRRKVTDMPAKALRKILIFQLMPERSMLPLLPSKSDISLISS